MSFKNLWTSGSPKGEWRDRDTFHNMEEGGLLRSFLAIELTESILKKIREVQEDLKSSKADVKWVAPDHIHLTLKFFGNIEAYQIDSILKAITIPVQTTPPLSLMVRGMGTFPAMKNPRVIWIGVDDPDKVLIPFYKRLETELAKENFPPEDRPFQPHLTLGRMRSHQRREDLIRAMEKYREVEFGSFRVERVILFRSDLTPQGPIYTRLKEVRLGEG